MFTAYPITAYSACNALGMTVGEVATSLQKSQGGLQSPEFELPFTTFVGALPDALAPLPANLRDYDSRIARLTLHCAEPLLPAIEKAKAAWGRERVAILMGSSTAGMDATEHAYAEYTRTQQLPADYSWTRQHSFYALIEVLQSVTGMGGPSYVISTACSSSAKVLGAAQRMLAAGLVDAVLVGGVDTLCKLTLHGFRSLEILSEKVCKPFSQNRDGINIGEGAAMVLIERTGQANTTLFGVGETSDAYHMTAPHPQGLGAQAAMQAALQHTQTQHFAVDAVIAHGTGTTLNDSAEAFAIESQLGPSVPVLSTKGYTGHLLGAAGATSLLVAIQCLEKQELYSSLGADPLDATLPINIQTRKEPQRLRAILCNAFAFGGNNVSWVVRKTP